MTSATTAQLTANRVLKGYTEADSRTMLADLLRRHDGDNLASALVYNGFATERVAMTLTAAS